MLQAILIGLIVFIGSRLFYRNSNVWKAACTGCSGGNCTRGYTNRRYDRIPTGTYIYGDAGDRSFYSARYDLGSVLGTAFAITTGKGMEYSITIAMPAAILSAFVVNLFYGVITPIMAKAADRFAEEGKYTED